MMEALNNLKEPDKPLIYRLGSLLKTHTLSQVSEPYL